MCVQTTTRSRSPFTSLTICPACAVLDRGKFALFALFLRRLASLTPSLYQHQHQDWPAHKADCKDLVKMRFTDVENRRRAETYAAPTKPTDDDDDSVETGAARSQ